MAVGQAYRIAASGLTGVASPTNPSLQVNLATNKSLMLLALRLSQNNNTTSNNAEFDLCSATSTATGTLTLTNWATAKLNNSDPAAGFALKDGGFTSAAGGLVVALRDSFNILNGYVYLPIPEERPIFRAADGFMVFRLLVTPASTAYDLSMIVQEIG